MVKLRSGLSNYESRSRSVSELVVGVGLGLGLRLVRLGSGLVLGGGFELGLVLVGGFELLLKSLNFL